MSRFTKIIGTLVILKNLGLNKQNKYLELHLNAVTE